MRIYAEKYRKNDLRLDKRALAKLSTYSFPGNVRELQYTMERAVIMAEGDLLQAEDLIFSPIETHFNHTPETESNLGILEKNAILRVIEKHGGNISKAAKELGLTRTALYRRLSKYEI